MGIAFYAGSFDPFTNGHLHVVEKISKIFDKVIIGIGDNPDKNRKFKKELMKDLIIKILENREIKNVEVICYKGLSAEEAIKRNATIFVRGIRNGIDYQYEENMASINEEISGIDTIYIRAGKLGNISSSMEIDLFKNGKDVSKYLPKEIMEILKLEENKDKEF